MKVTGLFLLIFIFSSFGVIQVSASTGSGSAAVNVSPPSNLAASAPAQTSATVGTALSITSTISNIGQGSTGASFPYFFQVATAANGGGTIYNLPSGTTSPLGAMSSNTASVTVSTSYVFPNPGTYSVRACANKSDPNTFGPVAVADPNSTCSGWTNVTVLGVIAGTVDVTLPSSSLVIKFPNPTPGPITYQAGFDFTSTSNLFSSFSNNYPAPLTYNLGHNNAGCGITNFGTTLTISSGTSSYTHLGACSEPGPQYGSVTKVVLWNLTLPPGYVLQLTPVRGNMTFETR